MHILVVHAMVILLTLGPPKVSRLRVLGPGPPGRQTLPPREHVNLWWQGVLRGRRCPIALRCTWVPGHLGLLFLLGF